jgi:hypothetical protein
MSKIHFVCLANSYKEGGRCIAGIELDDNYEPIFDNGNPKWVRPVCDTTLHGEIPTSLVSNVNILDIIEIEALGYQDLDSYQYENVLFDTKSLDIIGQYDKSDLNTLYDTRHFIFGNSKKALSEVEINEQNHSLMFIKVTVFKVYERIYEDTLKPQIRMKFIYFGMQYDLPVTDPVFLKRYQSNPDFIKAYSHLDMTLSIGIKHEGWYYKLIAAIIGR